MVVNIKKQKEQKNSVTKRELIFDNYKDSLFNDKIIIKSQQGFRSDPHGVCTVENNRTALSSNDDKRIQTYDRIATYQYGTSVFKVCENEMKNVCNAKETLEKNDELYVTSSIFLNYMKRKCTMEMKRYVKFQKKHYKI